MESLQPTAPTDHYYISLDTRNKVQLHQWLKKNESDPALHVSTSYFSISDQEIQAWFQDFLPHLKNHFLSRLLGHKYDGDELPFTASERHTVIIENNVIYCHKVLRVNYTTYDLRRGQESLNPRLLDRANVVVLSPENDQENEDPHRTGMPEFLESTMPASRIRHIGPSSKSPEPHKMDFLFVR
jgi:hypothetical protein